MKAAIVHDFQQAPRYGDIDAPMPQAGEVLVRVRAAALSQLVRLQAAGRHYSAGKTLPLAPGSDGVGVLEDGRRVYFAFPRPPVGAMAQQVAVRADWCTPIPEGLDEVTAAALGNPGMSSWAALEARAGFQRGENVLVNGAAGASGRLAIRIARFLGAGRIVATARDPAVEPQLRALGADAFIALNQPPDALAEAFRAEMRGPGVDVVLDYLWGPPAEAIFVAATSSHAPGVAARRLRFVNIGGMAGLSLPITAAWLRSSGLELTGSGIGSTSNAELVRITGQMLHSAAAAKLSIDTLAVPLAEVEEAWSRQTRERLVFTMAE